VPALCGGATLGEVIVMKSRKWMGVLVLGALLAVGCGGDDDDDSKSDEGSSGKGSTQDAGKPPGSDLPMGAVACGKETCELQEGETATLCCFDPFTAKCGMMQGTQGCVMRVESYPGCPSVMGGGGMFSFPSCCTADNMCGINASLFMPGETCTELGAAAMRAMSMGGGSFITIPPPQPCP
jgi:hypothetical protein